MARQAVTFDEFSRACPFAYMHGDGSVNNGYNCLHEGAYTSDDDDEVGCCFSWHCPLGTEAEPDDLTGEPDAASDWGDIDWEGVDTEDGIDEGELLLVDAGDTAGDDVKRALFAYHVHIHRYDEAWLKEHHGQLREYGYA